MATLDTIQQQFRLCKDKEHIEKYYYALLELPPNEQNRILKYADKISNSCMRMSQLSALELLAKIGLWLVKHK